MQRVIPYNKITKESEALAQIQAHNVRLKRGAKAIVAVMILELASECRPPP